MEISDLVKLREVTEQVIGNLREIDRLQGKLKEVTPSSNNSVVVVVEQEDCYITATEAGKLLGVNAHRIGDYERQEILHSYYLPDIKFRRYKKSEVLALPKIKLQGGNHHGKDDQRQND